MMANDIMNTGAVTKNFNERKVANILIIQRTECFYLFTLLHLTVSNLIHAAIPLLLF